MFHPAHALPPFGSRKKEREEHEHHLHDDFAEEDGREVTFCCICNFGVRCDNDEGD